MAEYGYDEHNRLIEEWDPRLSPSPEEPLAEAYEYGPWPGSDPGQYDMVSLTPPGEEPWEFGYYKSSEFEHDPENPCCYANGDADLFGRLKSVSRESLTEAGPATTTIAYRVPISGEDAPYDMSPKRLPNGVSPTIRLTPRRSSRRPRCPKTPARLISTQATVHYLDPDGYEVNSASPAPPGVEGDAIIERSRSPRQRRAHARCPQPPASARRRRPGGPLKELDSHATFSEDGTMLEAPGAPAPGPPGIGRIG